MFNQNRQSWLRRKQCLTGAVVFNFLNLALSWPVLAVPIEDVVPTTSETIVSSIRDDVAAGDQQPVEFHPLRLVLTLSERQLSVYQGDVPLVSYPVAVGREGWQTPIGEFSVFQKQENPAWENPLTGVVISSGPDNPLGTRWIGFWTDGTNAIGFHGTPDESVIGRAVSHGCVRMRHADIVALYEQIGIDTMVTVIP